jgi:type VI secretion system protein VasD
MSNRPSTSATAGLHARALAVLLLAACLTTACFRGKPAVPAPTAPPVVPTSITITAPPDAKIKAPMTVVAGADDNPDASGRPSPVVVRVYQLRTDTAFTNVEFFALFDDDKKALGEALISRDEFVLAPSEQRMLDVSVAGETRFVGAIAAFRDIRNAQWRALMPATKGGLSVKVERARVLLALAE